MVAFDPKVALRILREKQRRLDSESIDFLRQNFEHQMNGGWYDKRFYELDAAYKAKAKEAGDMWDVLDYLENRIESEKTREERIWDFISGWDRRAGVDMVKDVLYAADVIDGKETF